MDVNFVFVKRIKLMKRFGYINDFKLNMDFVGNRNENNRNIEVVEFCLMLCSFPFNIYL